MICIFCETWHQYFFWKSVDRNKSWRTGASSGSQENGLISTVSYDFVLWDCTINNGKILWYLFSVIRAIKGYNFTKYFLFSRKSSYIIAQMFGYPSKDRYNLRRSGIIACCRFYMKEGNFLWLTASKTLIKTLAILIVAIKLSCEVFP